MPGSGCEKRVVITGPNLQDALEELREYCLLHSLHMAVSEKPKGTKGRPRRQIPVEKIYDAYRRHNTVRGAARELDLPPGTVWDRLRDLGVVGRGSDGQRSNN